MVFNSVHLALSTSDCELFCFTGSADHDWHLIFRILVDLVLGEIVFHSPLRV